MFLRRHPRTSGSATWFLVTAVSACTLPHSVEDEARVCVPDHEPCPSSREAERLLAADDAEAEGRASRWAPTTVCWYRVAVASGADAGLLCLRDASLSPSVEQAREEFVAFYLRTMAVDAAEPPEPGIITCVEGGMLRGVLQDAEAGACPTRSGPAKEPWSGAPIEGGPLVGSDSLPGSVACSYRIRRSYRGGCDLSGAWPRPS